MNLRELAELDLNTTLEDNVNGFGYDITITDSSGNSLNTTGQSGDINFFIDPETGQGVSGRFAHIALRIQTLIDAGFSIPTKGWKVAFNDINGNSINYAVHEVDPDRTLGIVVVKIGLLNNGS